MLSKIIDLLKTNGRMTMSELALQLQVEVSAMEGMLRTLERSGRIHQIENKCTHCKGCVEVKPEDVAIFEVRG